MENKNVENKLPNSINGKYSYPYDEEYEIVTRLERINLDEEKLQDLQYNKGFIVEQIGEIKKDIGNINGIFSTKFGTTLQDVNPFMEKYKCECGELMGRVNNGLMCKQCKTPVKFIDDDFEYFGWIVLKNKYCAIHPNLYKSIAFFIGAKRLNNILEPIDEKDIDGYTVKRKPINPKDEPFAGIGMIQFRDKFKEVMDFYYAKNPGKAEYYTDIIDNMDKVFIHSIPVFTTHLRPYRVEGESLFFGDTNKYYNMIAKFAAIINKDDLKIYRNKKSKKKLLYDLQMKYNDLYTEIESILSGKKGYMRKVFGGRFDFSARSVIVSNPSLRADEVTMSYKALIVLLQQRIINILHKSNNMSYSDAQKVWYHAYLNVDEKMVQILKTIIREHGRGIPILLNRNPTIQYGSIMQMYVVDFTFTYTIELPLTVLESFNADFDGDAMNVLYIINKDFQRSAELVFNPRNAMQLNHNDGNFNNAVNQKKDTLINANTFINLSRKYYTKDMIENIRRAQEIG